MKYIELFNEYKRLYNEKIEKTKVSENLCEGYISEKIISNKKYYYLQKRVNKKLTSSYIKFSNLDNIQSQLNERKIYELEIKEIENEIKKLEKASKILNSQLFEKIELYKKCISLDQIPLTKRHEVSEFSAAMLSIEGVEVPEFAENEFYKWTKGLQDFETSYTAVLKKFNLIGVKQ